MGYPNYYPGYQPNYGYMPPMPDQLAQLRQGQYQQQINTPSPAPNNSIIWVQGEEGAKAYMVAANNSVMLMDSEASSFYIKSTDPSGMPLPLRVFDYTERTAAPKTPAQPLEAAGVEYVTRQEFDALAARIESLTAHKPAPSKSKLKEDDENA